MLETSDARRSGLNNQPERRCSSQIIQPFYLRNSHSLIAPFASADLHVVLHPQKTENETFSPSLLRELKTRKPWVIRPELLNFAFKQENLFASQLRCSSSKQLRPNHHVPRTSFLTLPYVRDSHFNLQQIPLLWTANNFRGLFSPALYLCRQCLPRIP